MGILPIEKIFRRTEGELCKPAVVVGRRGSSALHGLISRGQYPEMALHAFRPHKSLFVTKSYSFDHMIIAN